MPKMESQEKMKSPHTKTKPQADRTLAEEDTTAQRLRALSNTRPERASFALGMAAPTSTEIAQDRHKPAVPQLLIFGNPVPTKGNLVQQFRFNPSQLLCPQQTTLSSSLLSNKEAWNTRRTGSSHPDTQATASRKNKFPYQDPKPKEHIQKKILFACSVKYQARAVSLLCGWPLHNHGEP